MGGTSCSRLITWAGSSLRRISLGTSHAPHGCLVVLTDAGHGPLLAPFSRENPPLTFVRRGLTWFVMSLMDSVRTAGRDDTWAPDVSFHNGVYYAYYSVSTFGSQTSAIGLATSSSMDPGTWTDHGSVFQSRTGDLYNAIDPNLVIDEHGSPVLTFGEFTFLVSGPEAHQRLRTRIILGRYRCRPLSYI